METGDEVGGYTLVRRLGSGGAGTVWLAEDGGGTKVALKLLHPALAADEAARRRLEREAATVNSVSSDRVAHVVDIETEASQPFIATEFIEGPTLASLLTQGPLSPQTVTALAMDLARTLDAVHAARIVHRDIKPSNIICSRHGPILIDFGIAMSDGDEHFTRTGLVSGTAGYTAPELLRAETADDASDWWAWAATLLSASTGRPPYGTGDVHGIIMRVLTGEADLVGLDPQIAPILRLALSPDTSARPRVEEIVEEFLAVFGLPQGVCDVEDLNWDALFTREADHMRTQVIAPPQPLSAAPSPLPETRFLAESPSVEEASFAHTRAMSHAEHTLALDTQIASPPPPSIPPVERYNVAETEENRDYLPDFPPVPWVLGPALLMPLGMLPILLGASGTLILCAVLCAFTFTGACLRYREGRRNKAGAKRASDTVAMIVASPFMLVRAVAAVLVCLALGLLIPYGAWVLHSYALTGKAMWQTIPTLVTSPSLNFDMELLRDPTGVAGVWLVSWCTLLFAWCMPSAVDLRDGVARFTRAVARAWWMRFLVIVLCVSIVCATWILLTGDAVGAAV